MTLCLLSFSQQAKYMAVLPSKVYVEENGELLLPGEMPPFLSVRVYPAASSGDERLSENAAAQRAQLRLFSSIPLKTLSVHNRPRSYVMPCGQAVGVKLNMPGAFVVGLGSFTNGDGRLTSPAQAAGVRAGDLIVEADGTKVKNAAHLSALCEKAQGKLSLTVLRGEREQILEIEPALSIEDGLFKLGMWVRDSTAGIGTLSFYDTENLRFGALGHPVTDVDTGSLLKIEAGDISLAEVVGVSYGMQGAPGELHGAVSAPDTRIGRVEKNTNNGIYGALNRPLENGIYSQGLPLAYAYETELGEAQILSTVDETGVRAFDCEIVKKSAAENRDGRNLVLRITDPALLETTGGIVQGMSGSPIIQNGRLIAVVTHVFVNDPTKGYAVYAEYMYNSMFST